MRSTSWLTASMAVMFWVQPLQAGSQDGSENDASRVLDRVIPFSSPQPQSGWDQRRQSGRFVGGQPILFLDDEFILERRGIVRRLHSISKDEKPVSFSLEENLYGIPQIRALLPTPDGGRFLAYGSASHDGKVLLLALETSDGLSFKPLDVDSVSAATLWPALPPDRRPRHNPVLRFDEGNGPFFQYYYVAFFATPEQPKHPYGALTINKYPRPRRITVWRSRDGLEWEMVPRQQRMEVDFESNLPSYDPFRNRYLVYLRLWDPPANVATRWRKVLLSEGRLAGSGIQWTEPELVFGTDEKDGATADVYTMPVFAYAGGYIGCPWIYQRVGSLDPELQGAIHTQLAFSRDGRKWTRVRQGEPFLALGPPGSWDGGMAGLLGGIALMGNRLRFHYFGYARLHDDPPRPEIKRYCGSGTLRLDGFCSLEAGPEGGALVTVPFWPLGKHLYINADARQGEIRVEALQDYTHVEAKLAEKGGEPRGLFRLDASVPFQGDSTSHRVRWRHGENFADNFPAGWNDPREILKERGNRRFEKRAIALKFQLKNARIYSFWFADSPRAPVEGRLVPVDNTMALGLDP